MFLLRPRNPDSLRRQSGKERKNWLILFGDGRFKLSIFNLFHCLNLVAPAEEESLHPPGIAGRLKRREDIWMVSFINRKYTSWS